MGQQLEIIAALVKNSTLLEIEIVNEQQLVLKQAAAHIAKRNKLLQGSGKITHEEDLACYSYCAERGHAPSQVALAKILYDGSDVVPQNFTRSHELFFEAAKQISVTYSLNIDRGG